MSILGTSLPAAEATVVLYTCPAARAAVINVMISNGGVTESTVVISPSAQVTSPLASEAITRKIGAGDLLEITAISLSAGQNIFVKSSTSTVTFNTWGIEETV